MQARCPISGGVYLPLKEETLPVSFEPKVRRVTCGEALASPPGFAEERSGKDGVPFALERLETNVDEEASNSFGMERLRA